jgi:hypothetical protein
MKLVIPFLFSLLLSACGGGGGGSSSSATVDSTFIKGIQTDYFMGVAIVQGHFKNDSNTYVLVTGSQIEMGGTVPVNIFKLNENGGGTDVTADILGPSVPRVSVATPLVADFNNDGIDDIFLPGFVDISNQLTVTHLFLSRPGTYHSHQLLEYTWSHSATVADINSDGNLDVVDAEGKMWINDGSGNFTFKDHTWANSLFWMHGMGVCVGDFANDGRKQIVITDLNIANGQWPFNDTAVFELNSNLKPVAQHLLTPPHYEVGNSGLTEISHDVRCKVADMNNDGLQDIVVFSRPWASARNNQWTAEGRVQILINQGNFNFVDQTNLTDFNSNIDIDYMPMIQDFNGDGIPDIWTSPQMLISGQGRWTRRAYTQIPNKQITLPIRIGNKWGFVYTVNDSNRTNVYFTKPTLSIDL